MSLEAPGELEVYGFFSQHLGPRFQSAGLRIQFHDNQPSGIHFKVQPNPEYAESIVQGVRDGMALRFPECLQSGSVWITELTEHSVNSSKRAFYLAARMAIDQAFSVVETAGAEQNTTQGTNDQFHEWLGPTR